MQEEDALLKFSVRISFERPRDTCTHIPAKCSTLVYIGGGGGGEAVFCYSSIMVGVRFLKL